MDFNQIQKYITTSVDPPEDSSIADLCAFHCMRALLFQYQNRRISKEYAAKQKQLLIRLYERAKKDEESVDRIMKKEVENIRISTSIRVRLNKASRDGCMSKRLWMEAIECIGRMCGSLSELHSAEKYLDGIDYEEQEKMSV